MIPLLLIAIVMALIDWWPLAILFVILALIWPLIAAPFRLLGLMIFGRKRRD